MSPKKNWHIDLELSSPLNTFNYQQRTLSWNLIHVQDGCSCRYRWYRRETVVELSIIDEQFYSIILVVYANNVVVKLSWNCRYRLIPACIPDRYRWYRRETIVELSISTTFAQHIILRSCQYRRETVVELSISINSAQSTWSISMISTWNYRGTVDIDIFYFQL